MKKNKDVCITYDPEDIPLLLPKRAADSHKGDYGKILMITGSKGMAGAAYLSAKAAYAVGAGLVQIYTAEENRTVLQELLPEAIISCYNETAGKPDDKELEKLIQCRCYMHRMRTWNKCVCEPAFEKDDGNIKRKWQ